MRVNVLLSIFSLLKTNIFTHCVMYSVNIETLQDGNYYNDHTKLTSVELIKL